MSLLGDATIAHARNASARCDRIAYTSVDTIGRHPTIIPPPTSSKSDCVVVFVGERTLTPAGDVPATSEFAAMLYGHQYIVSRRTATNSWMSSRRFSKLPKLSPDLLFPKKWTVFFDTKLQMRASFDKLSALYKSTRASGTAGTPPFTAFIHPMLTRGEPPLTSCPSVVHHSCGLGKLEPPWSHLATNEKLSALTPSLRLSINTECARARRFTPHRYTGTA